jgi:hypothetical protein
MAVKEKTLAAPEPLTEPLFRGPRAGNTSQTLAPKTVNVLDPEPVWNSAYRVPSTGDPNSVPKPKEEIYGPDEQGFEKGFEPKPRGKAISRQSFEQRVTAKSPTTLENRVTKVEEQLDSLLHRIVVYNLKSSHKM